MFSKDSATREATDRLNGRGLTIGIVQARFNEDVTEALAQACRDELLLLGVADKNIHLVKVPGAPGGAGRPARHGCQAQIRCPGGIGLHHSRGNLPF